MRIPFVLLSAGFLVACTPASAPAAPVETPPPEVAAAVPAVLASFDAPAFLENLIVEDDGSIIFTNYTGKSLHRIAPDGAVSVLANLDVHPVSLIRQGETFLVSAHAIAFTAGPSFIGSGQLLTLSATGEVLSSLAVPEAGFLNGMVANPAGDKILIADSAQAQILAYDPAAGTVGTWYADPLLAPQTEPSFSPGANGLKLEDGALLVSSSATRTIYRLGIGDDGAAVGPLTPVIADLPGTDDFLVLPEGGYIASTHSDRVVKIAGDGTIETLTDDARLKGNTSVALRGEGDERTLIILGTGGLSEGLSEPGVVLAIRLPS